MAGSHTPGLREALWEKCPAQEHNKMSPARAQTQTTQSGDEHRNHKARALPFFSHYNPQCSFLIYFNGAVSPVVQIVQLLKSLASQDTLSRTAHKRTLYLNNSLKSITFAS